MDGYCPNCETDVPDPGDGTIEAGKCPICSGDLTTPPTGVEAGGSSDAPAGLPAFGDDLFPGSEPPSVGSDPFTPLPDGRTGASGDAPAGLSAWGGDPSSGFESASGEFERSADPASGDMETTDPGLTQDTSAGDGGSLPAHLQIPSMDLAMPSFDAGGPATGGSQTGGDPSSSLPEGGSDLPAHLQLPSFPQFDLPPIPGETPAQAEGEGERDAWEEEGEAVVAPPMEESPLPPMEQAPPPPPPKPRRRPPAQADPGPAGPPAGLPAQAPPGIPSALADLPPLGLPNVQAPEAKKDVTLLSSEASEELASHEAGKRGTTVVLVLLVLALIGGAGAAWYKRDTIVATAVKLFGPKKTADSLQTPRDRAMQADSMGKKAYENKRYEQALRYFKTAMRHDGTYADAHLGMAVVFASLKKPDDAVAHYKAYLELAPKAGNAAEVRKIIEEYEKKRKPKADDDNGDEKKRRRRRRRR